MYSTITFQGTGATSGKHSAFISSSASAMATKGTQSTFRNVALASLQVHGFPVRTAHSNRGTKSLSNPGASQVLYVYDFKHRRPTYRLTLGTGSRPWFCYGTTAPLGRTLRSTLFAVEATVPRKAARESSRATGTTSLQS